MYMEWNVFEYVLNVIEKANDGKNIIIIQTRNHKGKGF